MRAEFVFVEIKAGFIIFLEDSVLNVLHLIFLINLIIYNILKYKPFYYFLNIGSLNNENVVQQFGIDIIHVV
jgi:hypothetical protein